MLLSMKEEISDEPGDFKLSVRMLAEPFQGLNVLKDLAALDRACYMWDGKQKMKKPTKAAIMSALVLWISRLPATEQRRIVADGMLDLNRLVKKDPPASSDKQEGGPALPRGPRKGLPNPKRGGGSNQGVG